MTARREAPRNRTVRSDTLRREPATQDRALPDKQDSADQGIIKDERGQEQPADKKRATQNR
jgi:hypothetical protein